MAGWTENAIQELREYDVMRQSLVNIPDQISALELEYTSIKATTYDKPIVDGGAPSWEDRLINNIDRRERLKINREIAQMTVARIERGLAALEDRERTVLELFFVRRPYDYLDRLCADLGYEERNIYKIKDAALKKYTLAQYGVSDL